MLMLSFFKTKDFEPEIPPSPSKLDYKSNFSVTLNTLMIFYSRVSIGSHLILFLLNNIPFWGFTSYTLMPL